MVRLSSARWSLLTAASGPKTIAAAVRIRLSRPAGGGRLQPRQGDPLAAVFAVLDELDHRPAPGLRPWPLLRRFRHTVARPDVRRFHVSPRGGDRHRFLD